MAAVPYFIPRIAPPVESQRRLIGTENGRRRSETGNRQSEFGTPVTRNVATIGLRVARWGLAGLSRAGFGDFPAVGPLGDLENALVNSTTWHHRTRARAVQPSASTFLPFSCCCFLRRASRIPLDKSLRLSPLTSPFSSVHDRPTRLPTASHSTSYHPQALRRSRTAQQQAAASSSKQRVGCIGCIFSAIASAAPWRGECYSPHLSLHLLLRQSPNHLHPLTLRAHLLPPSLLPTPAHNSGRRPRPPPLRRTIPIIFFLGRNRERQGTRSSTLGHEPRPVSRQ